MIEVRCGYLVQVKAARLYVGHEVTVDMTHGTGWMLVGASEFRPDPRKCETRLAP